MLRSPGDATGQGNGRLCIIRSRINSGWRLDIGNARAGPLRSLGEPVRLSFPAIWTFRAPTFLGSDHYKRWQAERTWAAQKIIHPSTTSLRAVAIGAVSPGASSHETAR